MKKHTLRTISNTLVLTGALTSVLSAQADEGFLADLTSTSPSEEQMVQSFIDSLVRGNWAVILGTTKAWELQLRQQMSEVVQAAFERCVENEQSLTYSCLISETCDGANIQDNEACGDFLDRRYLPSP
jgi:hypothetical protein